MKNQTTNYFKKNWLLITIFSLYAVSVVISNSILPGILGKEQHISSSILSTGSLIFAIFFAIGSGYGKEFVKYRFNYFKYLRISFLLLTLHWIIYFFLIENNTFIEYPRLYWILKAIEGISGAFILFVVNNFFIIKLMNNNKNVEILGIQATIYFGLKTAVPFVFTAILLIMNPPKLFLIMGLITLVVYLVFYTKNHFFLLRYYKHIVKHVNRKLPRTKLKHIKVKHILPNINSFKNNKREKRKFYQYIFFQNSLRAFFDLLFFVVLTKDLNISYIQAGLLVSLMASGQGLQFFAAKIITKVKATGLFFGFLKEIPLIILFSILIYDIYLKEQSIHLLYIFATLTGISRAFIVSYIDKKNFVLIEKEPKFQSDFSGNKIFFNDIGNIFGYVLSSLFLLINMQITLLVFLIVSIILIFLT